MILPRTLLCAVLLLLLLLVSVLSKGKAKCSIVEILRQYQAVIFDELQNLKNLTRSAETPRRGRAGPACLSNKEQKILLSISTMSMSLRDMVRGPWRNPEAVAVMQVVSNTESVTKQNCKKIHKKSLSTVTEKPQHRSQGNRRKQLKMIARTVENLITCWEKLFSLHSKDWDT